MPLFVITVCRNRLLLMMIIFDAVSFQDCYFCYDYCSSCFSNFNICILMDQIKGVIAFPWIISTVNVLMFEAQNSNKKVRG